jgi:DNA-binding MarR family transcriptional regulator
MRLCEKKPVLPILDTLQNVSSCLLTWEVKYAIAIAQGQLTVAARLSDNCAMQQLQDPTSPARLAQACAAEILETIPAVMRFIRAQMRRHRGSDLSVPQFRTLVFLSRNPGASLSAMAEFVGLSLPAASRLVEGLVRKNFVERRIPPSNRRVVALSISTRGQRSVSTARRATVRKLAEVLASLRGDQRVAIQRALRTLRQEFHTEATREGL